MKDLLAYLQEMKNKTGIVTYLIAFLIGLNFILPNFVGDGAMIWVDFVGSLGILFFKIFAPSGTMPKGWTVWFYITNICFFALSGLDLLGAIAHIDPVLFAKIIGSINGIAAVAQFLNNKPAPSVKTA
jgi:hypothetical protein